MSKNQQKNLPGPERLRRTNRARNYIRATQPTNQPTNQLTPYMVALIVLPRPPRVHPAPLDDGPMRGDATFEERTINGNGPKNTKN